MWAAFAARRSAPAHALLAPDFAFEAWPNKKVWNYTQERAALLVADLPAELGDADTDVHLVDKSDPDSWR